MRQLAGLAWGLAAGLLAAIAPTPAHAQPPSTPDARLRAVAPQLTTGQVDWAVLRVEDILADHAEYEPAYIALALAYIDVKGDLDAAERALRRGLQQVPASATLKSLMGNAQALQAQRLAQSKQFDAALERLTAAESMYSAAIATMPRNSMRAAATLGLGAVHQLRRFVMSATNRLQEAASAAAAATDAYHASLRDDATLAGQVREAEIELALPTPRFPSTYSETHLQVSFQARLARLRAQLSTRQAHSQ